MNDINAYKRHSHKWQYYWLMMNCMVSLQYEEYPPLNMPFTTLWQEGFNRMENNMIFAITIHDYNTLCQWCKLWILSNNYEILP